MFDKQLHAKNTLGKWWKEHPEKRSEFSKKIMDDPKRKAMQAKLGREVFLRPEFQAQSLNQRMKNPVMMAGPHNHSGKLWRLRAPTGAIYEFVNLNEFIRQHKHLFEPEDVIWKDIGFDRITPNKRCRASALRNLHPDRVKPFATWKGWTWVSVYERRFNDGLDLLDRKTI